MNRRTLRQIALGLAVGTAVPLVVIAALLFLGGRDEEPARVVVSPSPDAPVAAKGLKVTSGGQLVRYLLTPDELGSGWVYLPGTTAQGRGSLDQAIPSLEFPEECSGYRGAQVEALTTAGAYATYGRPREGFFSESLYVFRPGIAQETLAFLRGLANRCGKRDEQVNLPGRKLTISYETKATPGPSGLGDESLRLVTTSPNTGTQHEVFVRIGDTLLRFQGTGTLLSDGVMRKAYEKVT